MIILATTTDLVQIITGSTQAIKVHASYVDLNTSTSAITPGRLNTSIATATTTTVVASPAASTDRTVKYLSIQNTGVAGETVTVLHTDGTTPINLQNITLNAGYTLVYTDGGGPPWTLYDANGNIQTSIGPGRWLKRTVILNGTTTFTTTSATSTIHARLQAAGGQGGGGAATAGECGSGGGSGAYAEWSVTVSPSTVYTCAVGAGGSTGGTGAAGQAGGSTSLTIGATTVTCGGGGGGAVGNSISVPVLGGVAGTASAGATINIAGNAGEPNITIGTAADNRSGAGAYTYLGSGGAPLLEGSGATGNAATGFGAGGGGASTTGTARAGGAGAPGVIIIDEYS